MSFYKSLRWKLFLLRYVWVSKLRLSKLLTRINQNIVLWSPGIGLNIGLKCRFSHIFCLYLFEDTVAEKLHFIPIESFIRKSSFLNPHPRK